MPRGGRHTAASESPTIILNDDYIKNNIAIAIFVFCRRFSGFTFNPQSRLVTCINYMIIIIGFLKNIIIFVINKQDNIHTYTHIYLFFFFV